MENKRMSQPEFQRELLQSNARIEAHLIRLNTAVMGDKEAGVDGLVSRVEKTEKYIEKDKRLKYMGAGGIAVVSFTFAKFYDDILKFFHIR